MTPTAQSLDTAARPHRQARPARLALAAVLLLPLAATAACAPQRTASIVSPFELGRASTVSYGTIVGLRPVTIAGGGPGGGAGVGTAAGALAGGVAGSFIGGDWRSNLLAGLGGAVIGGLAGSAIERGATTGQAVEFFVREDGGGDIAVPQTNEEGLGVGDRVVVARGPRGVRLSRAAGGGPGLVSPGVIAPSAFYEPAPSSPYYGDGRTASVGSPLSSSGRGGASK